MNLSVGTLVDHTLWGRGKVLELRGPNFVAYFPFLVGKQGGPTRTLKMDAAPIAVSALQNDPEFDRLVKGVAPRKSRKSGKTVLEQTSHTIEQALAWFRQAYPGGFTDERLVQHELDYKRAAHRKYQEYFGAGRGEDLLQRNELATIATGLRELFQATNIPSPFEMMAVRDGLKDHTAAGRLLRAVIDFVAQRSQTAFDALTAAVGSLPAPVDGTSVLTWPNVTLLPFLADPRHCMVLKPAITQRVAHRLGVDLLYAVPPKWHTYDALMTMSADLLTLLAPLGAKDFIDVQSFIWVTGAMDKVATSPSESAQ